MAEILGLVAKFKAYFQNYAKIPFDVSFDESANRFNLRPLGNKLVADNYLNHLRDKNNRTLIEQSLFKGMSPYLEDLRNVNIYPREDHFFITFTYGKDPIQISQYRILAQLAVDYPSDKLGNLCRINQAFSKACNDDIFWEYMLELKAPELYIPRAQRKYKHNIKDVVRGIDNLRKAKEKADAFKYRYNEYASEDIKEIFKKSYDIFKYFVLEDLNDKNGIFILPAYLVDLVNVHEKDALELLKHIINLGGFSITAANLLYNNVLLNGGKKGIEMIEALDEWTTEVKSPISINRRNIDGDTVRKILYSKDMPDVIELYDYIRPYETDEGYFKTASFVSDPKLIKHVLWKIKNPELIDAYSVYVLMHSKLTSEENEDATERGIIYYQRFKDVLKDRYKSLIEKALTRKGIPL
jgi:hypothetical protein